MTDSFLFDVILVVFGILQIILFFKIWGMTNNVKKILEVMVTSKNSKEVQPIEDGDNNPCCVGALVVDKNDNQWRVVEIQGDLVVCRNSTKGTAEFSIGDLKLFGR